MERSEVPEATIARLPVYLRCLHRAQQEGRPLISSLQIAQMCGGNAAQVRKDLSFLGELGTRGIGYETDGLIAHLSRQLGVDEQRRVAIVGYGRLGSALRSYSGLPERGFSVVAVFDADHAKTGLDADGIPVRSMDGFESGLAETDAQIVMLATPADVTQAVAQRAVAAGVKALLNMAPVDLDLPDDVSVRQVCISTDLQILSFHLAQGGAR